MNTIILNYGDHSEPFDQTTETRAVKWWDDFCGQNEPIPGDFTIELYDEDGNIIDEYEVEDSSPLDADGNKLSVGDIVQDNDGLYEITEIYTDRVYVVEVELDEDGDTTTISSEHPITRNELAKRNKF